MKKRGVVKGVINYIFAMVFAIIFGLFCNADVGWFILLTLILAPVMSVFFAWLSSRMLTVSCEMEDALLSKGDTCEMQVSIANRSIFPTPPIEVILTNDAGARCDKPVLLASVMSRSVKEFQVVFHAKICGKSTVGVERLRVTDYLGLFSFAVKHVDYASLKRSVAVIPDIAEVSARDDNLVKVMQASTHMEDGEDTVEASSYSFGGFPGYDNREYVPGDPLKRINWKQSAKRNKLLVRLDDEMASQSVNVVLDSVFHKEAVDVKLMTRLLPYHGLRVEEILPKMAEDAVENALGIMQILVRHNYTVNFFAMFDGEFVRFEIGDELDLENVRLELAHYSFADNAVVERLPKGDAAFREKVGLFSTPNSYGEAYALLESEGALQHTNVYSVPEEARKQGDEDAYISLQEFQEKQTEKRSVGKKVLEVITPLVIPYFLALLLSISVFSVFKVPFWSMWTLAQAGTCVVLMAFCEYVKKHRVIGGMLMTIFVVADMYAAAGLVFRGGVLRYFYWFVSGGSEIESTFTFLMTLILIFTVFFALVVYYFVRVLYRTSFLMLVSLIPFVVYVKVMLDINMVQVVFVTLLNVAAFLVNVRTLRDAGKPIVGYWSGLASVGLYALLFVLIGLAVPEAETKYYYMFENAFLGGNVTENLPQEYSEMSEFSGNADGFNELNDRKLYVITGVETGKNLYMKRQTFDLYDFGYDRWYSGDYYADAVYSQEDWAQVTEDKNLSVLAQALHLAEQYEPGFLAKYGLEKIAQDYGDCLRTMNVETMNFPSVAYITPPYTHYITVKSGDDSAQAQTFLSRGEVYQRLNGFLGGNIVYDVQYYDEQAAQSSWIAAGGANMDKETVYDMLYDLDVILAENGEDSFTTVVRAYMSEYNEAMFYRDLCQENTAQIPKKVRELAQEITKDCIYDWQKAAALQLYFMENDFVYDLEYKAPDDSVEYFLFEGKTGTCSDYASAYVLMARSVGLIVRYAEGFVPDEEYNGDYVIRTDCGHAYPEVYIPGVGYVVYEATLPATVTNGSGGGRGFAGYFMMVGIQIVVTFALVCGVILALLFLHKVAAPYVSEAYFTRKCQKAEPAQAVIMWYQRILQKHTKGIISKAGIYTPYEYAVTFEETFVYDISELTYMVEQAAYTQKSVEESQKIRARELYTGAVEAVKVWKKQKKK